MYNFGMGTITASKIHIHIYIYRSKIDRFTLLNRNIIISQFLANKQRKQTRYIEHVVRTRVTDRSRYREEDTFNDLQRDIILY